MENKQSRYFKYAIGEIVLVVIGILIAVQINTWNENRKNTIRESKFLISFNKDLVKNIEALERVINKSNRTGSYADSILTLKKIEIEDTKEIHLINYIMNSMGFTVYLSHEGTLTDIKDSGSLSIIKNDSIRLAIASWEANLKLIREFEKLGIQANDKYKDYLRLHIDLYKPDSLIILGAKKMEFLLDDRLFLNLVNSNKRNPEVLNGLYQKELIKLQELIKIIENESY